MEEWTLYLATKGTKVSQTAGPAQGSENTIHFNDLLYHPAQLCPIFRKEHKDTKSHNLLQASEGPSREEK